MERYVDQDLTGAEFRECVLDRARLIGVVMRDAEIDGVEEVRAATVDRRTVERHAKGVDEVVAEHLGVAERQRLGEVVDAARAGQRQHVVGLRVRCRSLVEGRHIAAEHRVVGAHLEVHAPDSLA